MVRLTAQLINMSAQKHNPVRDWELDLRGYRIPVIENLGATLDQFDTIDFTDNDIRKLDRFPFLKRLKHILLSNNRIVRVADNLQENLPSLETLILTNNSLKDLSDIDPLASVTTLTHLSLIGNPLTTKKNYRYYVIYKIPSLKMFDFNRVKQKEREAATKLFKKKKSQQQAVSGAAAGDTQKAKTFDPSQKLAVSTKPPPPAFPPKQDLAAIRKAIANAKTLEEIDRLNQLLKAGQIPGNDLEPDRKQTSKAEATKRRSSFEEEDDEDEVAASVKKQPKSNKRKATSSEEEEMEDD